MEANYFAGHYREATATHTSKPSTMGSTSREDIVAESIQKLVAQLKSRRKAVRIE
jgi:hypothetical protein